MTIQTQTKFPNRFDIVGSFLRPDRLKQANADFSAHKISKDDLLQVQHEEIKRIVDKQVALGLKDVTDGEFNRSWWHLDFLAGLKAPIFLNLITVLSSMVRKRVRVGLKSLKK